jgi:hypothetical protein
VEGISSGHSETPTKFDVGQECIEKIEREKKAAKRDDALPPYELWSGHILESWPGDRPMQKITQEVETALTALRRLALRLWRRHLVQEFLTWLRAKYGLARTDHTNLAKWN